MLSNVRRNCQYAFANRSQSGSVPGREADEIESSCSVTLTPDASIFSRSVRQTCARCSSTCLNPGRPYREPGGKYVPPKNGLRSGVSQTDMGQPPLPVVA